MIKLVAPFSASGGSVVSVNGKMGVVVLTPEDIGALPNGALEGYATEEYVQDKIKEIDIPETDLTGYATESYVQEKIAEAELGGEEVDLSAYATKQYVSEQVNAIELMPGPAGPQGPKGSDGYTPVKGVDYFDGAPGQPGRDGTDGKDGVDGAPGKDGVDGKDYVLTDADKQEIAGMVEVTGGEGGSVNIDNFTIIEENGSIRTAVGGGIEETAPEVIHTTFSHEGGRNSDTKIYFSKAFENAHAVSDQYLAGEIKLSYRARYSLEQGGEILEVGGPIDGTVYNGAKTIFSLADIGTMIAVQIQVEDSNNLPYVFFTRGYLHFLELYTPAVLDCHTIDNKFIDTEYIATKEYVDTSINSTRAYVEELIGGIENGSY